MHALLAADIVVVTLLQGKIVSCTGRKQQALVFNRGDGKDLTTQWLLFSSFRSHRGPVTRQQYCSHTEVHRVYTCYVLSWWADG